MKNEYRTNGTHGNGVAAFSPEVPLAPELSDRLRTLRVRVSPEEISDLWVFPPLADLDDSREFVLFTRLLPDEMRRVCAAEFPVAPGGNGAVGAGQAGGNGTDRAGEDGHANGNGRGTTVRITEYGRVPTGRVSRVVEGFRRRLGDDREPLHLRIGGSLDSWDRLLAPQASAR